MSDNVFFQIVFGVVPGYDADAKYPSDEEAEDRVMSAWEDVSIIPIVAHSSTVSYYPHKGPRMREKVVVVTGFVRNDYTEKRALINATKKMAKKLGQNSVRLNLMVGESHYWLKDDEGEF